MGVPHNRIAVSMSTDRRIKGILKLLCTVPGLESVVVRPYLGFCKVYQGVRNSVWLQLGAKATFFYQDSRANLN